MTTGTGGTTAEQRGSIGASTGDASAGESGGAEAPTRVLRPQDATRMVGNVGKNHKNVNYNLRLQVHVGLCWFWLVYFGLCWFDVVQWWFIGICQVDVVGTLLQMVGQYCQMLPG